MESYFFCIALSSPGLLTGRVTGCLESSTSILHGSITLIKSDSKDISTVQTNKKKIYIYLFLYLYEGLCIIY